MAMVPFATTCDIKLSTCEGRGPEYSAYPSCKFCGQDVCPSCMEVGTDTEDERNQCVCRPCARDAYADEHPEDFVNTNSEDT